MPPMKSDTKLRFFSKVRNRLALFDGGPAARAREILMRPVGQALDKAKRFLTVTFRQCFEMHYRV